jgi:dTDP-4-dehydrorhamnose reductase
MPHPEYESILITGARGMLAQAVERSLRRKGHAPGLLSRADLDVGDAARVAVTFQQYKPTLLINCAAYTKVDLAEKESASAERCNGDAVEVLAEACRQHRTKLVHYSTDYVFDGALRRAIKPTDATGPRSAYGRSKLLGEQHLQRVNPPDWLILRTAWLYGPGGPCFPQTMINAARAGKPLKVVDDQIGCPTYTRDLADATLNLIDAGANGLFHVVNAGETTWHGFTAAILEEFELKAELSRTTSAEWKQTRPDSAERPAYSVLDTSDYTRATGRLMRDWRTALRDYRLALEEPA